MAQLHAKQLVVIKAVLDSARPHWQSRGKSNYSGVGMASLGLRLMLTTTNRFLFYLSHPLRPACRGIGKAAINQISDIFLAPPKAIVATPVNELANIEEEVFLLAEDYHCINNSEIHEALAVCLI